MTALEYLQQKYAKRGWEKGLNEGLKEGRKQGLEQGLEQGIFLERCEVAKSMLADQMPAESIEKYTQLTLDEINQLKS